MQEMTMDEVELVDGGLPVAIGAVSGGLIGGYSYLTGGGGFSWSGLAVGIGSGAVGGAIAGMGGFAFAFYGGALGATGGIVANQLR